MSKSAGFFGPGEGAVDRRRLLTRAGKLLGGGAALAVAATAQAQDDQGEPTPIAGLWASTVVIQGSPSFPAFETWGNGGTWTGSGQPDLTPAALGSTGWGFWKSAGNRKYHLIGRFWTYTPSAVPTGYAALDFVYILSSNGHTYHATGTCQFFNTDNTPASPPIPTTDDGIRIA